MHTMKTPQTQCTNNYSLFVDHEYQRPLRSKHVNEIAEVMRRIGFDVLSPVKCWKRSDGKLSLIDGHHRVKAAELAGVFVYYVLGTESDAARMGEINGTQQGWPDSAFVDLFAAMEADDKKEGNSYTVLKSYMHRGISLNLLASLMENKLSGGGSSPLRSGEFEVKSTILVDKVLRVINELSENRPAIKTMSYVFAIASALLVKDFDLETFIHRAHQNQGLIVPCATRDQAQGVIVSIYNKAARNKRILDLDVLIRTAFRDKIAADKSIANSRRPKKK